MRPQLQLYLGLYLERKVAKRETRKSLKKLVGTPRFELGTPCTPCKGCVPYRSGVFLAPEPLMSRYGLNFRLL
jgi:hypothetical protein